MLHGPRGLIDEQKDETPIDYHYGNEHGWLEMRARYCTDAPIHPRPVGTGRH